MIRRVSVAFDAWPEADKALWMTMTRRGHILDDPGALAHLSGASLTTLRESYAKWLAWLGTTDAESLLASPAERVTVERLHAWMEDAAHYAPMSKLMLVDAVLRVTATTAPKADRKRVYRFRDHLRRVARSNFGTRKIGRVLSSRVLFDAGQAHAVAPDDGRGTPLRVAKRQRDGTIIAFLALMPMRARAASELALGSSVEITPETIRILLSGDMTKNGQPWEADVPPQMASLLRHYIDDTRPWLMARHSACHPFLWVNDRGQPVPAEYLSRCVALATERLVGVKVPIHFFRDAAATTLARTSPADAKLIRPLLGHLNFETADRHYIQAQSIAAGRDYAAALTAMKSGR